jgi:hypothetical protein
MLMGKFSPSHILSLFILSTSLFLGICNSERVAEILKQSADVNASIIGLRFNSIKTNYIAIENSSPTTRPVRISPCAIRVDVYNSL